MTPRIRIFALGALLAATAACGAGCAIVSYLVATTVPKPKVNALFTLPADQKVLVFPDDFVRQLPYPPAKRMLAEKLNQELTDRDLVADTVDYDSLLTLLTGQGHSKPMAIDDAATRLGAAAALYVDIRDFRLKESPADLVWKARMSALVRVVAADGHELWPNDGTDGYEVTTEMGMMTDESETFGDRLAEYTVANMADKIAKLFYKHRQD